MQELVVKNTVDVEARAETVWRVLTEPELTQRYMFGCRAVSDWNVGSSLSWEGTYEGKPHVFVKGKVMEIAPPCVLRYTVFDPHGGYRDVPANYVDVCFSIRPRATHVELEVTQGDFATVESGQKRYEETVAGWGSVLAQIKSIAESLERGK